MKMLIIILLFIVAIILLMYILWAVIITAKAKGEAIDWPLISNKNLYKNL